MKVVPYDCDGGYAVAHPVEDHDLWFILTDWDVNIREAIRTISIASYAYPLVKLPE